MMKKYHSKFQLISLVKVEFHIFEDFGKGRVRLDGV